jgi:hypothetical protein
MTSSILFYKEHLKKASPDFFIDPVMQAVFWDLTRVHLRCPVCNFPQFPPVRNTFALPWHHGSSPVLLFYKEHLKKASPDFFIDPVMQAVFWDLTRGTATPGPGTMDPHLSCLEIIGGSSPTRQVPENGLHDRIDKEVW